MFRFTDNVIAQMTRECNCHCSYCYERGLDDFKWKGKRFTVDSFKQAFDTYLYYRCILGRIENKCDWHFHGGEVLLLPFEELKQMFDHIAKRQQMFPNITWCLQTNATLITDEIARYFAQHNMAIGFSFDGWGTEDRLPRDKTRELMLRLRGFHEKYGTDFFCLSVLTKKNMEFWFEDMRSVQDFVSGFGINLLCSDDKNADLVPTPDDIWQYWFKPVLQSMLTDDPLKERGIMMGLEKAVQQLCFYSDDILHGNKTGCFDRVCGFGSNMTSLDPDLYAYTCDKYLERGPHIDLKKKVHITKRDFLGLQQAKSVIDHYQKVFKAEDKRHCDTCPASWICTGECQAYNLSMYGVVKLNRDMCRIWVKAFDFVKDNLEEILLHNTLRLSGQIFGINPQTIQRLNKAGIRLVFDADTNMCRGEKI